MIITTENLLAAVDSKKAIPFFLFTLVTTATAATVTSGYVGLKHYSDEVLMPSSLPSGVLGYSLASAEVSANINQATTIAALRYDLATLTGASTYAQGVTMPSKLINGASVQTAAMLCMLMVSVTFTGSTTPTITITYTNQDGVTGRTATLILPSNPTINSSFLIGPHLQSGDTGILSVQNITRSVGTVGEIKVVGLLPMYVQPSSIAAPSAAEPLNKFGPRFLAEANDVICFFANQTGNNTSVICSGFLVPEVN